MLHLRRRLRQAGAVKRLHGVQRFPDGIQIDAVYPDSVPDRPVAIERAQPFTQGLEVGIGPEPARPTLDQQQGLTRRRGGRRVVAHITIEGEQACPVTLDGDERESALNDQTPRQAVPPGIKFPRAVRGLAQQDQAGIPDGGDQGVQIIGAQQGPGDGAQGLRQMVVTDIRRSRPTQYDEQDKHIQSLC